MTRFSILFGLCLLLLCSCKEEQTKTYYPKDEDVSVEDELSSEQKAFKDMKAEIMEVHDTIMPKMSEIMRMRGKLTSLRGEGSNEEVNATIQKLETAHSGMMEWMKDFSNKFPRGETVPQKDIDKMRPVLKQEMIEILEIKDQTQEALTEANQLLTERS